MVPLEQAYPALAVSMRETASPLGSKRTKKPRSSMSSSRPAPQRSSVSKPEEDVPTVVPEPRETVSSMGTTQHVTIRIEEYCLLWAMTGVSIILLTKSMLRKNRM